MVSRSTPRSSFRPRRTSGFTLVELLVVMAILGTLASLVVVTVGQFIGRASEKSTVSLILRLQTWIDEYRSFTGEFPPDGFDSEVTTRDIDRTPLHGSASLHYFLTTHVVAEEIIGSRKRKREFPPVAKIEGSDLGPEDEDFPGAVEIYDGWGVPMHYDNTTNREYVPQDETAHYGEAANGYHPEDPREGDRVVEDKNAVRRKGIQSVGYDLWSHAQHGHDEEEPPSIPIGSWNVQSFK